MQLLVGETGGNVPARLVPVLVGEIQAWKGCQASTPRVVLHAVRPRTARVRLARHQAPNSLGSSCTPCARGLICFVPPLSLCCALYLEPCSCVPCLATVTLPACFAHRRHMQNLNIKPACTGLGSAHAQISGKESCLLKTRREMNSVKTTPIPTMTFGVSTPRCLSCTRTSRI